MKKTLLFAVSLFLVSAGSLYPQINMDSLFNMGKKVLDKIGEQTELTDKEETDFGNELADAYNKELTLTSKGKDKVENIGNKVIKYVTRKAIPYKFRVMVDEQINAFSMAGGNIWVTTGLMDLAENIDELAFVIAHEIAHEDKKHNMRRIQAFYRAYQIGGMDAAQLVSVAQNLFTLPFEKYQEYEADEYGVYLMKKAGYNTDGAISFFEKLAAREKEDGDKDIGYLFRTHPYTKDRIEKIKEYIKTL